MCILMMNHMHHSDQGIINIIMLQCRLNKMAGNHPNMYYQLNNSNNPQY